MPNDCLYYRYRPKGELYVVKKEKKLVQLDTPNACVMSSNEPLVASASRAVTSSNVGIGQCGRLMVPFNYFWFRQIRSLSAFGLSTVTSALTQSVGFETFAKISLFSMRRSLSFNRLRTASGTRLGALMQVCCPSNQSNTLKQVNILMPFFTEYVKVTKPRSFDTRRLKRVEVGSSTCNNEFPFPSVCTSFST